MKFRNLNLLLFMCVTVVYGNVPKKEITSEAISNDEAYQQYQAIDKGLKDLAQKGFKMLLPYMMEADQNMNLSKSCRRNLFDLIYGVRRLSTWSVMFLDAMGKLQSGLLAGNVNLHGEYDQCVNTKVMKRNGEINFRGQFCSVAISPPTPMLNQKPSLWDKLDRLVESTENASDIVKYFTKLVPVFYVGNITLDVCFPSGCDHQDVSQIMDYISGKIYFKAAVKYCLKDGDIQFWSPLRTFSVIMLSLLATILLVATIIDYTRSKKETKPGKAMIFLQCFSMMKNFPKFASLETKDESLAFFHGVRTLSIFWVLLGHEYLTFAAKLTGTHVTNYYDFMAGFFSQIILNALLSVDAFFFMSGFLNGFLRMQMKINGKKQPSIPLILIHRLLRIVPTVLVSMLVYFILNTPRPYIYEKQMDYIHKCAMYWWRDLVFINNFFSAEDICMPHSWYISADTQLFLLSLITVPLLLKSAKKGYALHIFLLFCGNASIMLWHYMKDLPPTIDASRLYPSSMMYMFSVYMSPVTHLGPYFIGIILGHALASVKVINLSKKIQVLGWLTAGFLFSSTLFITQRWNMGIAPSTLERLLYPAFSKSVYALSLVWLTIACKFGYGGIVNYILSLKIWFPLSKLTFMLYLISPFIQTFYHANMNFPSDFNNIAIVWSFLGSLCVSIFVCIFLVLMVESPFIAMEKILFGDHRAQEKSPNYNLDDNKPNKMANGMQNSCETITVHL